MEKYITDERTGLRYELIGDIYYLAGDDQPEEEKSEPEKKPEPIGIWGQRHLEYIKEHKRPLYLYLFVTDRLDSHLAEIDRHAENVLLRLVEDMAESEGVTEQIKAENQMEWVQRMNNIRNRAEEIVNTELIYGDEIYGKTQNQS